MSTEERSVNQPEEQPSLSEQRLIRRAKLKELQDAGQDPFQITKFVVKHHSADIKEGFEALEGAMTSVAGRIMSKRGMGKAVFCDLQDGKGRIQLYVRVDELGEEAFAKFKKTDIGDIVGVEGEVFKTKRGEISVKAHKVTLLSKSLQPLPEKFHGLTDKEMRYRQRYVDLIMNEDVRRAFRIRTAFIKHMRRYLDERDYLEVETPVLNTISGGATARPFITHHNTLDIDMYMRIATELNLKRLTVGGFERVYEIGPVFRAEKHATQRHLNEYTSLDLEMGFLHSFTDLMALEQGFLRRLVALLRQEYAGELALLGAELPDAEHIPAVRFDEAKRLAAEAYGYAIREPYDLEPEEEQHIGRYAKEVWGSDFVFVTHYPGRKRPFYTMDDPEDPRYTLSFDLLFRGMEITTGGQRIHNYGQQVEKLKARGMEPEDFSGYLLFHKHGAPPHGGMAFGFDRLVMLMLGAPSLREVIAACDGAGFGHIALCPETMGKINQLGDLDEVLELCRLDERLLPCIDFGHLYARSLGELEGEEATRRILDRVEEKLGADRASRFHSHFSKIAFTPGGGEKCHLTFDQEDFGPDPVPLMRELARLRHFGGLFFLYPV